MKNIMLNESLKNSIGVHTHTHTHTHTHKHTHTQTKGISLIVLVITIIIVIILAGAIILSLSDSNPIESANKAKFLSDVSTYKSDLALSMSNKYIENMGMFDPKGVTNVTGEDLKAYIKSMKDTDKNKFAIMLRRTCYNKQSK